MRWLVVAVLLLAGCKDPGRTTDTRSDRFKTAAERVAYVKSYAQGPTAPSDAEFHIVFHDNSTGLLNAPSDWDMKFALKVTPDQVELWARGCEHVAIDLRPEWISKLTRGKPQWNVTSAPDAVRCGTQDERLLHVREGVIFRHLKTN